MKRVKTIPLSIQPRSGAEDAVVNRVENLEQERETMDQRQALTQEFETGKIDWRNKIAADADNAREQRQAEFFGTEPQTYGEEIPEEIPEEITEDEDEDTDGNQLITKTINGKRVTRTVDEWIGLANKVEDADAYYAAAARQQVEATKPPPKVVDIKQLAQKLQLGSEEEATEALQEVMEAAASKVRQEKSSEDMQNAGKAVYQAFSNEFKDIVGDPVLNAALNDMDSKIINQFFDADPVRNFDMRLRHCAAQIRNWRDGVSDAAKKHEKKQELLSKKEKIVNLNTAGQKQSSSNEKVLSEKEAKEQAVSNMFASRKKRAF